MTVTTFRSGRVGEIGDFMFDTFGGGSGFGCSMDVSGYDFFGNPSLLDNECDFLRRQLRPLFEELLLAVKETVHPDGAEDAEYYNAVDEIACQIQWKREWEHIRLTEQQLLQDHRLQSLRQVLGTIG